MAQKNETVEMVFADPEDCIISQPLDCAPEQALWWEVLRVAYRDATGQFDSRQLANVRERDRGEALAWFASDETGPGSLRWIVALTGLRTTVAAIRARVTP